MARKRKQPEKLFRDMSGREKVKFLSKALVFLVSGGFIFPTIWID
jgi:hypothetical protein